MTNTYLEKLNNLYGKVDLKSLANLTFQDVVDSKNAILSVFSHTGIAGFKFHIPQREQVTLNSKVTVHYLENNEPASDHIVNEPVQITLQGYQGEYFYPLQKYEALIAQVIPTLGLVTQFLPQLSAITKQVKNAKLAYEQSQELSKVGNTISDASAEFYNTTFTESNSLISKEITKYVLTSNGSKIKNLASAVSNNFNAVDLFAIFQNLYKLKSAQTRAFLFFEALWKSKMTFSVETSWKRYDNMAITNVTPIRDNNADITDFKITLQQINRTYTKSYSVNAAGRTREQLSEIANKGTDKGLKVNVSDNTN